MFVSAGLLFRQERQQHFAPGTNGGARKLLPVAPHIFAMDELALRLRHFGPASRYPANGLALRVLRLTVSVAIGCPVRQARQLTSMWDLRKVRFPIGTQRPLPA